jgi:hypothetical protein
VTLSNLVIQVVFTLLFAVILVGWFSRPATDPAEVGSFASSHGLELTDRNGPMVTYYVRLAIVLRAVGGVSGLVLGSLFDDATGLDTSEGVGFWIWVLMGWLLGASWAEYRLTRPRSTGASASLTPRDERDYVSGGLLAAPLVAAAICATLAAARALAPEPTGASALNGEGPVAAFVAGAVGAVVIAALVRLAIRTVVARRQPTGPADIVAADDAIRASAAHHLAGGGTAAILLLAAQMAWRLTRPYDEVGGVGFGVTLVLLLGAIAAWRWYAYRSWRVRRDHATSARST